MNKLKRFYRYINEPTTETRWILWALWVNIIIQTLNVILEWLAR